MVAAIEDFPGELPLLTRDKQRQELLHAAQRLPRLGQAIIDLAYVRECFSAEWRVLVFPVPGVDLGAEESFPAPVVMDHVGALFMLQVPAGGHR
ncbi:hypothetical protein D3C81_2125410 [compost metagenome]